MLTDALVILTRLGSPAAARNFVRGLGALPYFSWLASGVVA